MPRIHVGYRIVIDIALLVLVFIAPWWLSLVLVLAAIFFFQSFYEALFMALLLDGFHGVPGVTFFGANTFFTSIIGAVFIVSIFLKERLRFY